MRGKEWIELCKALRNQKQLGEFIKNIENLHPVILREFEGLESVASIGRSVLRGDYDK